MEQENTVVLDLAGCQYVGQLHQRIKEAFDFPDFYGENWDAFYDLASMDSPANKVIICGVAEMSAGLSNQLSRLIAALERVKKHRARFSETYEFEVRDKTK